MKPTFITTCSLMVILVFQVKSWKYESKMNDVYYTDKILTVTTILMEPYTMVRYVNSSQTQLQANGNDIYEGYIVDLMRHLGDIIGFRHRLIPVWDGQFGYRNSDGSWSGMVGEVLRREADIAAGPLFITDKRSRAVTFTRPFMDVQATILVRKPADGQPPPIMSVHDLVNHYYIEYGSLNRGLLRRALRLSNITLYQQLWKHMSENENILMTSSNEEGINRVRSEDYAYIIPSNIGEYVSRRQPCDIMAIDKFLLKRGFGLAVQKGSSLLTYLNKALDTLDREGYLDRLYEKWWIERGDCNDPIQSSRVFSLNSSIVKKPKQTCLILNIVLSVLLAFSWEQTELLLDDVRN